MCHKECLLVEYSKLVESSAFRKHVKNIQKIEYQLFSKIFIKQINELFAIAKTKEENDLSLLNYCINDTQIEDEITDLTLQILDPQTIRDLFYNNPDLKFTFNYIDYSSTELDELLLAINIYNDSIKDRISLLNHFINTCHLLYTESGILRVDINDIINNADTIKKLTDIINDLTANNANTYIYITEVIDPTDPNGVNTIQLYTYEYTLLINKVKAIFVMMYIIKNNINNTPTLTITNDTTYVDLINYISTIRTNPKRKEIETILNLVFNPAIFLKPLYSHDENHYNDIETNSWGTYNNFTPSYNSTDTNLSKPILIKYIGNIENGTYIGTALPIHPDYYYSNTAPTDASYIRFSILDSLYIFGQYYVILDNLKKTSTPTPYIPDNPNDTSTISGRLYNYLNNEYENILAYLKDKIS